MKLIQLILIQLILGLVATGIASSENITDVSRYFYNGDGRLKLVSAINGITFNGQYRQGKGIYDEKALKTIHRLFGGQNDRPLSTISLRLIAPLQQQKLQAALDGCDSAFVIEQNHGGQLFHYLRGVMDFSQPLHRYSRAGPLPLSGKAIAAAVIQESRS